MQRGRLRQSGDKRRPRCTPNADWSEAAVACRTGGRNARTLEGCERGDGTGLASKGLSRLGRDSTGPIGPPLVVKVDFSSGSHPSAAACEIVEPEFSAGVALGARGGDVAEREPSRNVMQNRAKGFKAYSRWLFQLFAEMETTMLILAMLLAGQSVSAMETVLPTCHANQLRLSLDPHDGEFNGMSHSGTELSIRNTGSDCMLIALPAIQLSNTRGLALPAVRQTPRGMHPGPVMVPVRLPGGHRAATNLRWVSGPVFPHSRSARAGKITVQIGTDVLRAPLVAVLYGEAGKPITFEQAPLHVMEGMAAD